MVAGSGITTFCRTQAPEYMSAPPYEFSKITSRSEYFQTYRNENYSKIMTPRYEWGMVDTEYTPPPRRTRNPEFLKLPMPQFSMLDKGRQMEVDNFFMASQMHRDTYMDHSKILKPMDFFKPPVYKYQCPQDLSSTYLKYPTMYVEYKKPTVLPLTLGRTRRSPLYPEKALTGIFNPESDISHKK